MLDHDAIVARLRDIRSSSSSAQVREGRAWYPAMGRLIATIGAECAEESGEPITRSLATGVFAAFSQNATWKANVTMATNFLSGRKRGGMKSILAEIERMLAGENPADVMCGLKRGDFYSNLMGDYSRVTCDRWHIRAATGQEKVKLTAEVRDAITRATVEVAAEFGESPAACQAVIWCTVRPSGNGQ